MLDRGRDISAGSERAGETWRTLARAAAIAVVVVLPVVVRPWGEGYNQVKATTMYALVSLAVAGWLGSRMTTGAPRWRITAPEIAGWGFLLAVLLSTAASVNPRLSVFGAPGRYEGMLAYGAYLVLFFLGVHFFGSRPGLQLLATAGGAAAAATIVYGAAQVALPPLFAGEAFIRTWYAGLGVPRIPSTLGSPVVFGGYLSVLLPLLLALAASAAGRARALWLAVACLGYVAAALTLTRAAWLAILTGSAVLGLALGRQGWRHAWSIVVAVVGATLVAVLVAVAVAGSPSRIGERVASSIDASSGSLGTRLYIWGQTVTLIRAKPWLGWGLETLGEIFPYDRPALVRLFGVRPVIIDKAHNDLLQTAVSVGIPGAAAYLAFWALVMASAVRLWRREAGAGRVLAAGWLAAITAYLVQVQFSFSTVALAPVIWLLAGAACGWEARVRADEVPAAPRSWSPSAPLSGRLPAR